MDDFSRLPANLQERIRIEDGHWFWLGGHNGTGRPVTWVNQGDGWRPVGARRWIWSLLSGIALTDGDRVDRTCDHNWCVNPDHALVRFRRDQKKDRHRTPRPDYYAKKRAKAMETRPVR